MGFAKNGEIIVNGVTSEDAMHPSGSFFRKTFKVRGGKIIETTPRSEVRDTDSAEEKKADSPKSLRIRYAEWLEAAAARASERQQAKFLEGSAEDRTLRAINAITDALSGKQTPLQVISNILSGWAKGFRTRVSDEDVDGEKLASRETWRSYFETIPQHIEEDRDEIIKQGVEILFEENPPQQIAGAADNNRAEVRGAAVSELALPAEISIPSLAEAGVSVRGLARTALEVTQGLLAVALLEGAKAKAELLKLVTPERTYKISKKLLEETRGIARMVLGINQKTFEITDAFALSPEVLQRLMENNGAGVIAMREAFMGTDIAALTDAKTLAEVNEVLEKAGLEKFLTAQALKKRLPVMKQAVVRAVIIPGETLSEDAVTLLKIADKNIIRMTEGMLKNLMRVMEYLVTQFLGEQAMSHSA